MITRNFFISFLLFLTTQFSFSQTTKNDTKMTKSKTIVFIHGLFVNPSSWAEWKTYFEAKGYTCYTPANPCHEGNPADLRKNINPNLVKVGFEDVVMNIVKLIDSLPEKPIVIGHSLAGLVVQKLVEMDKVSAGICIDGATPKNVTPSLQAVFTNFPVINPLKGSSIFFASRKWFNKAFCTNLTRVESDIAYDKFLVPESRNIPRETLSKSFAKINLKKPHCPLLHIGGGKDIIIPARMSKRNAEAYKDKNSISDFKEFKDRCHFTCGEKNWQDVADFIYEWLNKNK